jgi:mono/diheme cytochrome c family protein
MNIHSRLLYATIVILAVMLLGASALARQGVKNPEAAKLSNPVASTPETLGVGKRAYDTNCAACHGNLAQGAAKAGIAISIIAEQGGKQPPDLTDAQCRRR